MKHYITGASGFIGQHVCRYLADRGHDVIPVDHSLIASGLGQILAEYPPFIFVHLSAYGNHSGQTDPKETIRANIMDLHELIWYLQPWENLITFYNVSTSAIQLKHQTLYSLSKYFGEKLVEASGDQRFVSVRPYSVYGPGEADHRFIPTVIRALQTGETIQLDPFAKHDWIYVEDFVDAMFKGYTRIGTSLQYSNLEVVEILEKLAGKKLNYQVTTKLRSYDTDDWTADNPVPYRHLDDGLAQVYQQYAGQLKLFA